MAAPLPDFDHFAALSVEIEKDERLTVGERALLSRAARRMRRDFYPCSELQAMHACNAARANVEVLAAKAAKRLEALAEFNKTVDTLNRAAYRFGKPRQMPEASQRKASALWTGPKRPGARAVVDEEPEAGAVPVDGEDSGEAAEEA